MTKNNASPQLLEAKWQARWAEDHLYRGPDMPGGPSFYCLCAIQDPAANGLTIGHLRSYIATDVLARFRRMQGYDVLHPLVWDTFGLPVQRAAEERGQPYGTLVEEYVAQARSQLLQVGLSVDGEREFRTSDADYYRWTQWGFLHFYKRGLIYQGQGMAYMCRRCNREWATSETRRGTCPDCRGAVEVELYPQWFVSLAPVAPRLWENLRALRWPPGLVRAQSAWLGRQDGYVADMATADHGTLEIFFERVEWLEDVTFIAVDVGSAAAQGLLTDELLAALQVELTRTRPDELQRGKTVGVLSGERAVHPLTGRPVPILLTTDGRPPSGIGMRAGVARWRADDAALAHQYGLPPGSHATYTRARAEGLIRPTICYRVRDWRISRRRAWGAPLPLVECSSCGTVPYPEDRLPLAARKEPSTPTEHVLCPQCGKQSQANPAVIAPFACISWYFLRAVSPRFPDAPLAGDASGWLPVDVYIGAAHHALLHLLFARAWTQMWYQAGIVDLEEPFQRILPYGTVLDGDGRRMSRAYGNVVWVHDALAEAGADALRLGLLQLGSLAADVRWDPGALQRASRLLQKLRRLVEAGAREAANERVGQARHQCRMAQRAVTRALEEGQFHLALAALARLMRELERLQRAGGVSLQEWEDALDCLLCCMAPFAPHLCEELWEKRGHRESIHRHCWAEGDEGGQSI